MPTFLLVKIADDGTPTVATLTDPVSVTDTFKVPLSSLLPPPPAPPEPPPAA